MKQIVRIFLALATVAAGVVLLTIGGSAAGAQSDHELAVSENSNRSNASELSGANVQDDIFVFVTPEAGIDNVQFFLDGSNSVFQTEQHAPYDFAGTSGSTANAFDVDDLSDGAHNIRAQITLNNGDVVNVDSSFTVGDDDDNNNDDNDDDNDDNNNNDDDQPSGNISPNGSFTAVDVGTFESSRSGFPAENAIDGNLDTRWSSSGEDRNIYVDLGGVARIDDVGIAWFDGNDRVSEFRIYTRTGTSGIWNEVFEGESSGDTAGIEIFNVDDEDARFVRIEVESNDFNGIQNISEIQVFGVDQVGKSGSPSIDDDGDDDDDDDDDNNNGGGPIGPAPELDDEPPAQGGFGLSPNRAPQDNFDLSRWALDTPAPRSPGSDIGERINENEYDDISDASQNFFFTAPDGGLRFVTRLDGGRTSSGTSFVRSELREMLRAGDTDISTRGANQNNWALGYQPSGGDYGGRNGLLEASLRINKVTTTGDGDHPGRTIVGQIHAEDDEPLKLYYRKNPGDSHGCVYAAAEVRGGDDIRFNLIGDSQCNNVSNGIALDELWSYEIENDNEDIIVRIRRGDQNGPIIASTTIDMNEYDLGYDVQGEWNYFKVGAYTQNNTGDDDDGDIITFYRIEASHDSN